MTTPRYYLSIKTAPHQSRYSPAGWEWDNLDDAKAGARKADSLWMSVRLIDGHTGAPISYDLESLKG